MRRLTTALLAFASLATAACSDDAGPGSIRVEISADVPLAAASVELLGTGIQGVSESPGLWVAGEPLDVPDGTAGYRAVVLAETPGTLVLTVEVADLDARLPEVQLLQVVGANDRLVPDLSSITAEVRR